MLYIRPKRTNQLPNQPTLQPIELINNMTNIYKKNVIWKFKKNV